MITIASIERDDPNRAVSGLPVHLARHRSSFDRYLGRSLIGHRFPCRSSAIVIVAATAAVIFACFYAGRIPVKLVLLPHPCSRGEPHAIVRSFFVRIRDDEDPGRAISESDAPALRQLPARSPPRSDTVIDEIGSPPARTWPCSNGAPCGSG